MTKTLEQQIRQRSRFQLTDAFGKGRIRNLMYEYDCLRTRKNKEINWLKDITVHQAEAVTSMVIRSNQLEQENAMLRKCIKEGDEARKSLAKKLSMSEARLAELEQDYLVLKNKEPELCMEEVS